MQCRLLMTISSMEEWSRIQRAASIWSRDVARNTLEVVGTD